MPSTPLVVLLQLPPLAFGPVLPPPAFAPPRALTCPVGELGRPEALRVPVPPGPASFAVDPASLRPGAVRPLVHPAVDGLLVLLALASTHGGWDDRTWGQRTWAATGAATPVLIPALPPPRRP